MVDIDTEAVERFQDDLTETVRTSIGHAAFDNLPDEGQVKFLMTCNYIQQFETSGLSTADAINT